jgi:hypothetical protein
MDGIRDALLAKFGEVPVLDTYRQMAIRQQKVKDWQRPARNPWTISASDSSPTKPSRRHR